MWARVIVEGNKPQKPDPNDSKSKPVESAGLCFNTAEESAMVEDVFNNALSGLSEADRNLDAIQVLC